MIEFDTECAYDAWAQVYEFMIPNERGLGFWVDILGVGRSVLEIGSGVGRLSVYLQGHASLTCVDISAQMLERAKHRVGADVKLIKADARSLPISDDQFDWTLVTRGVYGHMFSAEDQIGLLREAARVTQPGGRIVVDVANFVDLRAFYDSSEMNSTVRLRSQEGIDYVIYIDYAINDEQMIATHSYRILRDGPGRVAEVQTFAIKTKLVTKFELSQACYAAGLANVRYFGDYGGGGYHEGSSRLIAVAEVRRLGDANLDGAPIDY